MKKRYQEPEVFVLTSCYYLDVITPGSPTDDFANKTQIEYEDDEANSTIWDTEESEN